MQNVGCIASIISKVVALEKFQYTFSVYFEFTIKAEIFTTLVTFFCFLNSFTNGAFFVFLNIIKSITDDLFTYIVDCLFISYFLYFMKIDTSFFSPAFSVFKVATGFGMSSFPPFIFALYALKMIVTDFIRFVLDQFVFVVLYSIVFTFYVI